MNQAVQIAAIVSIPTAIVPMLTVMVTSRSRRAEKKQDYDRQDAMEARTEARAAAAAEKVEEAAAHAEEVAQQARRAAELLQAAQEETIKQADEVARLQAESSLGLGGKLDMIHAFVNSDMTARMRTEIALMREIVGLREEAGSKPSSEALAAISRLEAEIAERDRQQLLADKAKADNASS
jgi:hypothetical protein